MSGQTGPCLLLRRRLIFKPGKHVRLLLLAVMMSLTTAAAAAAATLFRELLAARCSFLLARLSLFLGLALAAARRSPRVRRGSGPGLCHSH